jgi:hypothetical protein
VTERGAERAAGILFLIALGGWILFTAGVILDQTLLGIVGAGIECTAIVSVLAGIAISLIHE